MPAAELKAVAPIEASAATEPGKIAHRFGDRDLGIRLRRLGRQLLTSACADDENAPSILGNPVIVGVQQPRLGDLIAARPQFALEALANRTVALAKEPGDVLENEPARPQLKYDAGKLGDKRVSRIVGVASPDHREPLAAGAPEDAVDGAYEIRPGLS